MTSKRIEPLIDDLLAIAGDYRKDDRERQLSRQRVVTWLGQFPAAERHDVLAEIVHLLCNTYISRGAAAALLTRFLRVYVFGGSTAYAEWQRQLERTRWLVTQPAGSSQSDLLDLLDEVLDQRFKGLSRIRDTPDAPRYVLLDDALFTGLTTITALRSDHEGRPIIDWIPPEADVWVVVLACYREGWRYVREEITPDLGNRRLQRYCHLELDGRRGSASDVLWPTEDAVHGLADPAVAEYVSQQQSALDRKLPGRRILRIGSAETSRGGFTSLRRRDLVETRFLQAGVRIRAANPQTLRPDDRPLGFEKLIGVGFGTPLITYRNAPNNAPLVLHEGPLALFPRRNRHRPS